MELNAYLGTGQAWDLDRNSGGVFVLPPYQSAAHGDWYSGTANAVYQNIPFIDRYAPSYVLILSGDHIYKMDYAQMLKRHEASKADATIAVRSVPIEEAHRFGVMSADESGQITAFEEKPKAPKSNKVSMGIYIFTWPVLKRYLIADAKNPRSNNDFGQNIIPALLSDGCKLQAYEFKSYWKDVGTIQSLWEANMDMLTDPPLLDLSERAFDGKKEWRIFSKSPILPPHYVGQSAAIDNAMITEGCEIEGSVKHSVVFAGVTIEAGAVVADSVLMPGAHILRGAKVTKAIIGEGSTIGVDAIVGAPRGQEDADYDTSLTGDITLIASDTIIAQGERVLAGRIVNSGASNPAEGA
jgi:glucose-1-phosphate adenylyltransferase